MLKKLQNFEKITDFFLQNNIILTKLQIFDKVTEFGQNCRIFKKLHNFFEVGQIF